MSKKQKEKKKKQREQKSKSRVLAKRKILRQQLSEEKKKSRLDKKFRSKIKPIIKDPEKRKIMENIINEKILSKLEKNAEILRQLEQSYLNEIEHKKALNQQLESEGHSTIEQKLSALENKIKEKMNDEEIESGRIDTTSKD